MSGLLGPFLTRKVGDMSVKNLFAKGWTWRVRARLGDKYLVPNHDNHKPFTALCVAISALHFTHHSDTILRSTFYSVCVCVCRHDT
jgi:hypothetical protein